MQKNITFYDTVDTLLISKFVCEDAISAVNICTPMTSLMIGIAFMFGEGGNGVNRHEYIFCHKIQQRV